MKKPLAAILILLYLAASSGIVINSHYCMKRLVSVDLFQEKARVCGLCGMDMHNNNGCCHDEVKVLKVVQDQVSNPAVSFELPLPEAVPASLNHHVLDLAGITGLQRHFQNHSPPLISAQDSYLQHRVFRI